MKAIVLTCDKYIQFTDHMIYTYQKLWPDNPFCFRVPYGEYPSSLDKYGNKVKLIQTEAAKVIHPLETESGIKYVSLIKKTVLTLLADLPDEEWIYWCMDDRYLINFKAIEAQDIYQYIISVEDPNIVCFKILRDRPFRKNKNFKMDSRLITQGGQNLIETIFTEAPTMINPWEHQFLRVKALRKIFESFPERPFVAKEMDEFLIQKTIGEKSYVVEKNIVVFGETTSRGQITENCVASFKKWGFEIPSNFPISKKYHVTGELPYNLLGKEFTIPEKAQNFVTQLKRWYWRNK